MATLQYKADANFQSATLGSNYTAGSGSLVLSSGHGARFPASGNFYVRVDNEIFLVTSRSTDTLAVTAAQDGTANVSHSAGVAVDWVLPYSGLDQLRADITRELTVAQFDALTSTNYKTGDHVYLSDGVYRAVRTASAWSYYYGSQKCYRPDNSAFAWINQGTATVATASGAILLADSAGASYNLRIRKKTAPAAPYTVTVGIIPTIYPAASNGAGVLWRESSSGKLVTARFYTGMPSFGVTKWSSPTSYTDDYFTTAAGSVFSMGQIQWIRLQDNSTNRIVLVSNDGINFVQVHSISRTDYLTADEVGFFVDANGGNTVQELVLSWREA
jgi:hypothetical protein